MNARKWIASLTLVGLAVLMSVAGAGQQDIRAYTLFGGNNVDSTAQSSTWVPIRGASRVVIRTWTAHSGPGGAAFDANGVDSAFSDSIQTWVTLFSDSVCCFVTSPDNRTIASAADSVQISGWGADSVKHIGVLGVAVNKALRAPATGSGLYTIVYPTQLSGVVTPSPGDDVIHANYMRVRITPLRRHTANTSTSIAPGGVRVNGLRLLKMIAYVHYANK